MPKRPPPKDHESDAALRKLGERIDARATELRITTTQISEAAGVTWAAAQRWRKGRSRPSAANLLAIARVLRMSPTEFADLLDERAPAWAAWDELLRLEGDRLSDAQRARVIRAVRMMLDVDQEPSLAALQLAAAAVPSRR